MRKFVFASALLLGMFAIAPTVFAQLNSACDTTTSECNGNLICVASGSGTAGTCQADPQLDQGDGSLNSACIPPGDCDGNMVCDVNSDTCQEPTTAGVSDGGLSSGGVNDGNTNASTGFVPLAAIPGLTDNQSSVSSSSLATFFNNLYKYLIGLAAVLAVIQIIRGGLEYATQDSVGKKDEGKRHIQQALFGLVLVLSPYLIFSIINPSILNLSLNLPQLKLINGSSATNSTSATSVTTTTLADGVTQKVTGTTLQTATFSSNDAAKNNADATTWANACTGVSGVTKPLSTCSSYQGTTCLSAGDASAYCGHSSAQAYTFFDTSGFISVGAPDIKPVPADESSTASFASGCSQDSGYVCALDTSGTGMQQPKSTTCPSGVSGKCLQTKILCTPASDHTGCTGSVNLSIASNGQTSGCTTTTGSEYKTATCTTEQAGESWVSQNCKSPSVGTVSSGSYQGSSAAYSVACPGVSSRTFTFVELDKAGDQVAPVDQDLGTVQGFVSGCDASAPAICLLATGSSDNIINHAVSSCPAHTKETTESGDPTCYTANVVCSDTSQSKWYSGLNLCLKGTVLVTSGSLIKN